MAFGATPVDGSSPTPIPMSSAVPDGSITPLAIAGGPSYTDTGNTKVPVSMYVKDGNDLTQGLTTDTAVTGDTAGTLSAKLRGLSKMLFDMWDSTNHWLQVKVMNGNANGQALSSASAPVVISSDQSPVATKSGLTEVLSLSAGSLNADLLPSTDVSGYKWFSCQITGTWSGTLTVQVCEDNFVSSPVTLLVYRMVTGTFALTIGANDFIQAPIVSHYMRIRMTAYTSGTANAIADFYTSPAPSLINQVIPGNIANTTPWLVSQANNNASVPTGAANTVIKGSAGAITSIVVTTAGTGAGNVTIFDNASTNSGTPLAVFPATVSVGQQYPVNGWAKLGMTAQNVLNGPVFTVYYA